MSPMGWVPEGLAWGGRVQGSNRIEGRERWWALGAVIVVMFSSALSSTIVATAVPTIVRDLRGFDLYGWVFTAYMLCSTVVVPITGKLSDIYGRRPFYLSGILLFTAGSLFASVATSMEMLIVARCVSGIGGGAMMAMATCTISDIFSPRERGRWMGLTMSAFGLASVIGPTIGGVVTDHWGWRWVFVVNLPITAIALLVVGVVLPRLKTDGKASLDIPGVVLLVASVVPILLAITWGGTTFAWTSPQEIACFAGGAVMLAAFIAVELRSANPLLSPTLFKNRVFSLSVLTGLCVSFGMFGTIQFLPLFIQGVLGKSAQASGLVTAPMMIPFVLGSVAGGQVMARTGRYRLQGMLGTAIAAGGLFLLTRLGPSSDYAELIRDQIVIGLGVGLVMPIFSTTVLSAFPQRMVGTVNSARQFFQSLGSVIGVPLLTSIMVQTFGAQLAQNVPRPLALGAGLSHAFTVSMAAMCLAFLCTIALPERPLRSWGDIRPE
jgi:EmrB/QacA subfamily drug resistance transporter